MLDLLDCFTRQVPLVLRGDSSKISHKGTRTSIEIALCRLGISAHVAIGEKLVNLSPTVLLEQFPQQTANFGSIRFLCG